VDVGGGVSGCRAGRASSAEEALWRPCAKVATGALTSGMGQAVGDPFLDDVAEEGMWPEGADTR